ncbi:DEAD/DEAH box helicase [Planomonospora parontospora]|uniref:DEAD/DEAH box helicase n=1 Tax=Planomonospora parontospora TaxID=58119 RepID=UPI001670321E|nr:DEAD/DEAH box helicase [Planomonospora parontospora]GGL27963.1 DEAD/DEAH box helicase [Planomonospora parontospora subsp. antibiotica]GII16457.1 DEAD/DEAH box helicase [Planomonospora parontospora subsp. antibiotica]
MSHTLDPLATSGLITDSYRRYLRSLLPVREPRIAEALAAEITRSPMLTKGPLLEATPPYATGATLERLVEEGVLDPAFRSLESPALPLGRPLYRHQEHALRKAAQGRNLVVATGTGSGKTESFLLPILSSLIAEHARGELGPGVRALLLYPMNALANDQLKRLRQLLARVPQLTFGRYTGDTPESARVGAENFESLNPGEPRLTNELLSREEMRAAPPHLLLTNYAMLEYLLLRPADLDLFEGRSWRFIALDEAHVYDGAKAAELAMLLRRLHDRVAPEQPLQCIATSATVGDDPAAVTEFAEKLFDVPFEWVSGDPARQDLVRATRVDMPTGPFWGPLSGDAYRELAQADDPGADLLLLAKERGFAADDPGIALAHEQGMAELRGRLSGGPVPFGELARLLFDPAERPQEALAALVAVGSKVRDRAGSPVLSARYHLFARATEGAFTCLTGAGPHVSLGRREICGTCQGAMFEFGACKRCGAVHLTGAVRHGEGGYVFEPRIKHDDRRVWLLLGDEPVLADEDDEDIEGTSEVKGDDAFLCAACGGLHPSARLVCGRDGCTATSLWPVRRLNLRQDSPSGCASCGARGTGMVRQFESGNDAAVAVLASALYQALPAAGDDGLADQPGEGRKLLSFSDSRQAAAFFAPYFESSYSGIQHRRLILEGLEAAARDGEAVSVADLTYHVAKAADRAHVFARRMSRQQREREVALWITQELVALDDRQSLEGLGLLRVELERERRWTAPPALRSLGLSEDECWALLSELLRTLRQQGVLRMPEDVDPRDEAFDPRRGPIYVREDGSEPGRKVLSWLPTRGVNRRLDYVRRVLAALGSDADPKEVLRGCWKVITAQRDGWLAADTVRGLGTVRQVDHEWLRFAPADRPAHRCGLCRRVAAVAVRGVCPTLGCRGTLEPFTVPPAAEDDNHYRAVYRSMTPVPLVAREHTAQWTSMEAADIQQRFLRGEVNMLSCSTTFELGVDVGELQSVVLRNMPPTTANYVQRAGRAGRRTDSAALVVTYAQRRSHDLSRYQDPVSMIAGEVRAPYVPLGNERIDRRHAHSIALSAFFRHARQTSGETWGTAGEFFLPGAGGVPASRVRSFLTPVPREVLESLLRVLPPNVQREIGVNTGEWVDELCRLLERVRAQLAFDVEVFEERRHQAYQERKDNLVARYAKTINTLTQRNLLGYLANRNVLPKYGFPVDTVELRTAYSGESVGAKLELTRDLSAAIYEYAPGSEVVAGGLLWRSGGVYRLPDRELVGKTYLICDHCQYYWEGDGELDPVCPSCATFAAGTPRQYYVPEFGFVAEPRPSKTTTTPPKRSWNGTTHVLSLAAEEVESSAWSAPNGGKVEGQAGSRGQLIAVSEGPTGAGYLICDWCGAGAAPDGRRSKTHTHLLRGTDCGGPRRLRSLAHPYETDILHLAFDHLAMPLSASTAHWRSLVYALLEGAAECLELSRDDIDGTLYALRGGRIGIVLFDAVPGGAGSVLRIARSLDRVVEAALKRVADCDCGEETSCYGCLRSFRNQRHHEELSRGLALRTLQPLVAEGGLQAADGR